MNYLKKSKLLSIPFSNFSTKAQQPIPIKVRYSDTNFTNLIVALPHQQQKIFFINENFTFNSLKDMFLLESPLSKINISYPSSLPLKNESNLLKFLQHNDAIAVDLVIDGVEYVLKNDSAFDTNQIVRKLLANAQNNRNNSLFWHNFCINHKIPQTNISTLTYFLRLLNNFLEKHGMENNLSNEEKDVIIEKILKEFSCPLNQNLEGFLEKLNEIESEINSLQNTKEKIEENTKKTIYRYQKLIVLISLVQIVSFYYMIFHVEWLGWDIIEPITYTISQITLLFGIRFFLKHGRKRDFATMQEIFMRNIIGRNRELKDKYRSISENLLSKRVEKQKLEWQIKLLKNQRTYDEFL